MKLLKWLDRTFDKVGMAVANYYLNNFCLYK